MADVCVLKMSAAPRSAVCQCRLRLQIGGGGAGLRGARADPAARAAFPLQSEPDLSCHNEQGGREASRRDAEQLANRRPQGLGWARAEHKNGARGAGSPPTFCPGQPNTLPRLPPTIRNTQNLSLVTLRNG